MTGAPANDTPVGDIAEKPLHQEWDVYVVEYVWVHKPEWRAFTHGTFDTLAEAVAFRDALTASGTRVRICRYVGSSSETREILDA